MASKVQLRRDTATQWGLINPILADGEIGLERDTKRFKIGDGVKAWNALLYSSVTLNENPANAVKSQHIINTSYDGFGRIDTITYSDGNKAKYTYTPTNYIQKITYTDMTGIVDICEEVFTYDGSNRFVSVAINLL